MAASDSSFQPTEFSLSRVVRGWQDDVTVTPFIAEGLSTLGLRGGEREGVRGALSPELRQCKWIVRGCRRGESSVTPHMRDHHSSDSKADVAMSPVHRNRGCAWHGREDLVEKRKKDDNIKIIIKK